MKKRNVVKESRDFSKIMKCGKKYLNDAFSVYYFSNDYNDYRFGISVSKKIGNAVVRNKIKRQMRNIIDKYKNIYPKNKDYIIIIRRNYLNLDFSEINNRYADFINRVINTKEKNNEKEKQ